MTTLDAWSREVDDRIDFIKIDVEGYESNVLAGAADLIVRWRPPIFMEFNSVTIAHEARRSPFCFAETLWEVFDLFSVDADGDLTPAGGGSMVNFVLQNMVHHGCVDDIILILKPTVDATGLRRALMNEVAAGESR
jgi:methyltransferase FkbM-like protein